MANPSVTHEELLQLLQYTPETGVFTWKVDRRSGKNRNGHLIASKGDVAGGIDIESGYVQFAFSRGRCRGHRLAVFYMTGSWPSGEVDHKNTIRSDNRWENLRDVPRQVNKQNLRRARCDSRTGVQGVMWNEKLKKFMARVKVNEKQKCVGYFDTTEAAHSAYVIAKRQFHAGCTI